MKKGKSKSSELDGLREIAKNKRNDLGYVLQRLFPGEEWSHNCSVEDANGNKVTIPGNSYIKPDFCCKNLRLIVEYDGAGGNNTDHFTDDEQVEKDRKRVAAFEKAGYRVVSIPPYVQMDLDMIEFYFGNQAQKIDNLYKVVNEHGFLHPDITLPAEYSDLGIERFEKDMKELPIRVCRKIIETLKKRIDDFVKNGNSLAAAKQKVLPRKLYYLLEQDFN